METVLYLRFFDEGFLGKLPEGYGVYFLLALNENYTPIPINRICGIDPDGIMYIGCTPKREFRKRLNDLRKCIMPQFKSTAHSAGRTYNSTPILMEKFPISILALKFDPYDAPKDNENRHILEYRLKYGEVPPLNSY